MATTATCPQCSRQLRVPDELLGRLVKCPSCSTTFTASTAGEQPPPLPVVAKEPAPSARPPRVDEEEIDDRFDDYYEDKPRRKRVRRSDLLPHRGTVVLVMGILSLVVMPIILGPIAWVMANNDLKEMRAGRMDPEGESNTNAGRICGIIGTIMGSLGLICCFGYVFIVMIVGASGAFGRR